MDITWVVADADQTIDRGYPIVPSLQPVPLQQMDSIRSESIATPSATQASPTIRLVPNSPIQVPFPTAPWLLLSLMSVWLTIALTRMTRSLSRSMRFGQVLNIEGTSSDEADQLGSQVARSLGLTRMPKIKFISASLSPMLFGFGRSACIVVPQGLWNELNPAGRRALLAHELSHYQRGDHWVRTLELIVGSLYFWFPLVRMATAQIERMEETCCDLKAVEALDRDRRSYAESLLQVVDYISQRGGRMPGLASGMRPTITLEERIRSIMSENLSGDLPTAHWRGLMILGSITIMVHPLVASSEASISRSALAPGFLRSPDEELRNTVLGESEESSSSDVKVNPTPARRWSAKHTLPPVPNGWWTRSSEPTDPRVVASVFDGELRIRFAIGSSLEIALSNGPFVPLSVSSPTAIAFFESSSIDVGKRLIVGNAFGDIRMWDLTSHESVSSIGQHGAAITTLCYHPKLGLFAGDTGGQMLQWDIQSGAIQNSWASKSGAIRSVRCNPAGTQVAVVCGEWNNELATSKVVLFNPRRWRVTMTLEQDKIAAAAFYRDDAWYVADWDGSVQLANGFEVVGTIPKDSLASILFSQDCVIPDLGPPPITEPDSPPVAPFDMEGIDYVLP
jgi:bla regulator protein blaR1